MKIDVLVEKRFTGKLKVVWLKKVIKAVLDYENIDKRAGVSLVVTDQERMRELNKTFLGKDRATDVLAFPMGESGDEIFITPPEGKGYLGEVIISLPQAVIQAVEHAHPVEREVAVLIIHGMLHLLGYDHTDKTGKRAMQELERKTLNFLERVA